MGCASFVEDDRAEEVLQALGANADDWLGDADQLGLFASPDAGR